MATEAQRAEVERQQLSRRQLLRCATALTAAGTFGASKATTQNDPPRQRLFSAADNALGQHQISWLDWQGSQPQSCALPFRAHDLQLLPDRDSIIVFGRRPSSHCARINLATGETESIDADANRHFYGHGCLADNDDILLTTENDYEKGIGKIGIRDARTLQSLGEYSSFGVGPHDIHLMPDGKTLVVANGGIRTHPDFGRRKLNIDTMQPSLVYIDLHSGRKVDEFRLHDPLLSIRHLHVTAQGDIGIALQYQGDPYIQKSDTLIAWQPHGGSLQPMKANPAQRDEHRGYIADLAYDPVHGRILATSPRGNVVSLWDTQTMSLVDQVQLPAPSGVQYQPHRQRFIVSCANGRIDELRFENGRFKNHTLFTASDVRWDNHLILG